MFRLPALVLLSLGALSAEVHTLTLRQAVEMALKQNPDLALARLDEQKAEHAVRLARDPFVPKIVAGSGLAYSSGFPMSIEGATPSILQARAIADVFNRPQSYRVAAARENRRGAAHEVDARQEEVAYRTAELFLEAERAGRIAEIARRQVENLEKVTEVVRVRVQEGRELPIEAKRAALSLARARYRAQLLEAQRRQAEDALAAALALEPGDQIRVIAEERELTLFPPTPESAVEQALKNSKELRGLESKLVAKGFEIRAERANRLPRLDLVAQYGLLARFNNYEDFFRKFQRHNGQLGVSFQIPLSLGPGVEAQVSRAEAESAQLRINIRSARNRIAAETRRLYEQVGLTEAAREVARLDLEVARDQVSILLAQHAEGRAGLKQVEEARFAETEKWIAFYDAAYTVERARLSLLRQTGLLLAALR